MFHMFYDVVYSVPNRRWNDWSEILPIEQGALFIWLWGVFKMSVPYSVNFKYTCTDCGIDHNVFNVTWDFDQIDICLECLDERKEEDNKDEKE